MKDSLDYNFNQGQKSAQQNFSPVKTAKTNKKRDFEKEDQKK